MISLLPAAHASITSQLHGRRQRGGTTCCTSTRLFHDVDVLAPEVVRCWVRSFCFRPGPREAHSRSSDRLRLCVYAARASLQGCCGPEDEDTSKPCRGRCGWAAQHTHTLPAKGRARRFSQVWGRRRVSAPCMYPIAQSQSHRQTPAQLSGEACTLLSQGRSRQ